MSGRRIDVKAILADEEGWRRLLVDCGLVLQLMEGIPTTREQMEAAYDHVRAEGELIKARPR